MSAPAFRVDGVPATRAAFYAIACDPARSCAVEACAGSGKTWMLVSRMLRALLDGAAPHEILAITFTRAAAGEMRQRLNDWLAEYSSAHASHGARVEALVLRGVAPDRAQTLAPALGSLYARVLAAGRPIEIRTFHAWFSQLLRVAPLALLDRLGLAPEMELVEDLEDHKPAVMRAFHAAVLRDPELRADYGAMTARRGRNQLRKWLDAAWWRRVEFEMADEAGVLDESVESAADLWPEVARFAHPVDAMLDPFWQARLRHVCEVMGRGAKTFQEFAAEIVAACESGDARTVFEAVWRSLYTEKDTPRVLSKANAGLAETQQALGVLGQQVDQEDARIEHGCMVRLGRTLLVAFADYKRRRGLADMADLERCALALLRDDELSGWVQERLDARIRHVLIDEFQDTSPLQWHTLHAWLSAYAGAGGGASGQRRPGVFIVGDPKQSIYRFRGAEPRVFAAATRFVLEGLEGRALACDHTRRNAPEVIAAINGVFEQAVADGAFEGFRSHTTQVVAMPGSSVIALPRQPRDRSATRPDPTAIRVWRDSLTTPRLEPDVVLREQEAAAVARAIRGELAVGTPPAEIFVLCRKRETLRLVAAALEREQIGHSAVEDTALASTPEAQDLIAVLDAIVSPAHRLSLARALRSPLFGASDADLLALSAAALAAGDRDWWRALAAMAAPGASLERARSLLQRWRLAAAQLPPHDLLDRIVHEGELRERTVAVVPAEQRALALDAIDAVLAQALLLDGGRYSTPYGFVRALKRRAVKSAPPVRADAVRLLTVHGAKGLEADTVFITDADPERPSTETTTLLVDWPVEAEHPRRCAFLYSESRCPPSLVDLLGREIEAREREEMNALYVAMTRAKRRLVFSATEPFQSPPRASWWQRVAPYAATVAPAPIDERRAPIGEFAAAFLQVLPKRSEPASAPRSSNAGLPSPASLPLPLPLKAPSETGSQLNLSFADPEPVRVEPGEAARALDRAAASLGRAVHRALEWAGHAGPPTAIEELAAAAAAEFGVAAAVVERHARAILAHPDGQRFFTGPQIRWSGNEIAVSVGGEVRRIDRLVQVDEGEGAVWWVLDYKLRHDPQALVPYRQQLLGYRDAVRAAQPGHAVRCAFITGDGRVVEIA